MLPANELTRIQADLLPTLPDTCNILTAIRTPGIAGGWVDAWGTTGSAIPCRVDFKNGHEAVTGAALQPYTAVVITLPQTASITTENQVEHGGNTYTVQTVNLGSWLGVKRATLEKIVPV
jgi:hypothetical protein